MKGIVELDFNPFSVPNFVTVSPLSRVNGVDTSFPLDALEDATFHSMVDEWVRAIYAKAKKQQRPSKA